MKLMKSPLAAKLERISDKELEAMSWAEMERLCGRSRQILAYRVRKAGLSRREAMIRDYYRTQRT